ncbi:DUF2218 domain-containing protein [Aliiruegeria sabulilitoris]|uniref:DUF2218 domain-containing protein n=1 Tax=Aliiruegeria sabulilitoris TaxID=1510458 RepID=UPI000831CF9E|nr:DUF2218 domain-containing protein [Aliiruegeria sabulilitoris]NDR57167.1 DUF2218 domain-containing protein [Pseudoruegeria sp. M32A2M]
METRAEFHTAKGAQYIASLCKHFGRKVPVKTSRQSGRIELPFGLCLLTARDDVLELAVTAESRAELDKAAEVLGSHLERFAFRENPEIIWQPAPDKDAGS